MGDVERVPCFSDTEIMRIFTARNTDLGLGFFDS